MAPADSKDVVEVKELPKGSTTWGNEDTAAGPTHTLLERLQYAQRRVVAIVRRTPEFIKNTPNIMRTTASAVKATPRFVRTKAIPARKRQNLKKHVFSFLVFLFLGIAPFISMAVITSLGNGRAFTRIFDSRTIACGDTFTEPANATVSGIEALFALDLRFGRFTFAQAKVLDATWDLAIAHGAQLLASYTSYRIFLDAILYVIERHPAPFATFTGMTLDGPSWASMWKLACDLWSSAVKSKRTKLLLGFMMLSIMYVLSLPVLLSAMTGYTSTSSPWLVVRNNGTEQVLPITVFEPATVIHSLSANITFNPPKCLAQDSPSLDGSAMYSSKIDQCDCALVNGTILTARQRRETIGRYPFGPWGSSYYCTFEYPNNNQTYTWPRYSSSRFTGLKTDQCKDNVTLSIFNYSVPYPFPAGFSQEYGGLCLNDKAYSQKYVSDNTRCLPDATEAFQWGFSSMLMGIFVILHFAWSVSMYAVWLDAAINSKLLRRGFQLTQLRAAFALGVAAGEHLDKDGRTLVLADIKELHSQLHGGAVKRKAEGKLRKMKTWSGAEVDRGVFGMQEDWERKRRTERWRDEDFL